MTPKQARFAQEYLLDLCGAAAARRAGYSHRGARNAAYRLLQIPEVRKVIDEQIKERSDRTQVKQDQVIRELKAVAFSAGSDENGSAVKLASKLRALELLGKHLGLFEGTGGKDHAPVRIVEDV